MLRPPVLRVVPLVLLAGLTLTLPGAELPAPPAEPGGPALTAGKPIAEPLGGAIVPLCLPVNENGCSFSDIVCSGHNCCCVYACPSGSGEVGPCTRLFPLPL